MEKNSVNCGFSIHRRHEKHELCLPFLLKPWIKTPVDLCKSCRGLVDLQLWYRFLSALLFKNFVILVVKQGQTRWVWRRCTPMPRADLQRATRTPPRDTRPSLDVRALLAARPKDVHAEVASHRGAWVPAPAACRAHTRARHALVAPHAGQPCARSHAGRTPLSSLRVAPWQSSTPSACSQL
jgi:hypothetical protein